MLLLLMCPGTSCRSRSNASGSVLPPRHKLSPALRQVYDDSLQGSTAGQRVMVDLVPQIDLTRLDDSLRRSGGDRALRRRVVVGALRRVAEPSQNRLEPVLRRLQRRGMIGNYQRVVIVNRFIVRTTAAGLRALAAESEVAAITEETASDSVDVLSLSRASGLRGGTGPRSWALDAIGVGPAWRRGLDGRGVVIGIIDAGASAAHEQLRQNYRGGDASWYSPAESTSTPTDILRGHGTGVLSAAVGGRVAGTIIGVAPAAQWIACAGLPLGHYNNVTVTLCADWMLTTGQPDVLINAWQLPYPGCDRSLQRIMTAWHAAGILSIFAAGNDGPVSHSDRSPANYGFSVGSVTSSGTLFPRSSRGPNSCDGSIYPTVAAPGDDVPVAYPLTSSTYIRTGGTSVAAGLTAGAAALLLQRDPGASVDEIERALREGTVDAGSTGPDNDFGYGRLSVSGALKVLGRIRTNVSASPNSVAPTHK